MSGSLERLLRCWQHAKEHVSFVAGLALAGKISQACSLKLLLRSRTHCWLTACLCSTRCTALLCVCIAQESVFDALQAAVRDCKNFKVRINAALSLSMPTERATYRSPRAYSQVRLPTERATYRSPRAFSQVREALSVPAAANSLFNSIDGCHSSQ